MSDIRTDAYWTDEFEVTTADLERIAQRIRETLSAYDLTELANRVVRGRLRHGPETSVPAQSVWTEDPSVRLWDPAGEWRVNDHIIVWTWSFARRLNEVMVGEVVRQDSESVTVRVEDSYQPERRFLRAQPASNDAEKWRKTVEDAIDKLCSAGDVKGRVESVILQHGERVVSQLLDALRADDRFIRLAGHWFLRELAVPPTGEQLTVLAWAMVPLTEPLFTADLAPLVQPPLVEGDPGLFGLYLAVRDRPDLFGNADPGQRPRWVLAGPPPGAFTPRYAAYDPETYEVLCLPDEPAMPKVARRLWDLGLLKAVVGAR